MRTLCLLLTTLLLAACAERQTITLPQVQLQPASAWDMQLRTLEGKTFEDAKLQLGRPESQYEKNNIMTYIWRQRTPDGVPPRDDGDWRPARRSNVVVVSAAQTPTCTIKADTVNGIVSRIWSEGTPGGCAFINDPRHQLYTGD